MQIMCIFNEHSFLLYTKLKLSIASCFIPNVFTGFHYLSEYGWYIVLAVVCAGIVWMKLGPVLREWWARRKEREEELNFGELHLYIYTCTSVRWNLANGNGWNSN